MVRFIIIKKFEEKLSKHHKFITQTDSEVIVHLLEEHFNENNDLIYAIRKTVAELDGVYSLVIKDEETGTIALVRDKMGVRQIYYGENDRLVAFASERKALWKVGIKEPTRRVLPGQAIVIPASGLSKEYIVANPPIQPTKIRYKTMNSAIREVRKNITCSHEKTVLRTLTELA